MGVIRAKCQFSRPESTILTTLSQHFFRGLVCHAAWTPLSNTEMAGQRRPIGNRGVLATLGAETLPNRGILHPPGVWRLPTKSSLAQRGGRGAGGRRATRSHHSARSAQTCALTAKLDHAAPSSRASLRALPQPSRPAAPVSLYQPATNQLTKYREQLV